MHFRGILAFIRCKYSPINERNYKACILGAVLSAGGLYVVLTKEAYNELMIAGILFSGVLLSFVPKPLYKPSEEGCYCPVLFDKEPEQRTLWYGYIDPERRRKQFKKHVRLDANDWAMELADASILSEEGNMNFTAPGRVYNNSVAFYTRYLAMMNKKSFRMRYQDTVYKIEGVTDVARNQATVIRISNSF
jgi:hypothetical protein